MKHQLNIIWNQFSRKNFYNYAIEEKNAAKNANKCLNILNKMGPIICNYYRSVFLSIFLSIGEKNDKSVREDERLPVKKLQKVLVKKQKMFVSIFESSAFSKIFTGKTRCAPLKQKNIYPWKILRTFPWTTASGNDKSIKVGLKLFFAC